MRALWVGPAGALLVGSLLLAAGCGKKDAAPDQVYYKGPLFETENVVTLLSDSARLHIRLTSPLEQIFDSGDRLYPKGAAVTFYDKPGKLVVNTLTAKWVKFDGAKQLYIMRGAVKVANVPQQQKLDTEELFYDRNRQKIYTDTAMFVRVQTPTEVINGRGLTADQNFGRYSLKKVSGTFSTLDAALQQGKK